MKGVYHAAAAEVAFGTPGAVIQSGMDLWRTDVIVVGGGPVGLFLGCRLASLGLRFVVLERRPELRGGSRSIGVHPPSLERLAALGIAERLVRGGVAVERGRVLSSRGPLGAVDLTRQPGRFRFILSVPQALTERLLAARLEELAPGSLVRGAEVVQVEQDQRGARAIARREDGGELAAVARAVVGCDGKESAVRRRAGIPLSGSARPESYLMGDFEDETGFASDAAIFLADGGLVESFPLPGGLRRWVVESERRRRDAPAEVIAELVARRTGCSIRSGSAVRTGAFGVEQRRAPRLVAARLVLAGDAAHVLSPFGGQGMNLGFLDAWDLARALAGPVRERRALAPDLSGYERRRQRAAGRAARRAALSGLIGRRRVHPRWRNAAVAVSLAAIPDRLLCALFTMRGLG